MDDDLYDDEGPPPQLVEMPSTISPLRKVPVTVSRINLSIHSVLVYNQCSITQPKITIQDHIVAQLAE